MSDFKAKMQHNLLSAVLSAPSLLAVFFGVKGGIWPTKEVRPGAHRATIHVGNGALFTMMSRNGSLRDLYTRC